MSLEEFNILSCKELMEMVTINTMNSYLLGGYVIKSQYNIRQYYEMSNVFIAREEDNNNNGYVFAYGYLKNDFKIQWTFPHNNVIGIRPIIPELKKVEDFITHQHYENYIEKFAGKELLEVYAGEFRYIVDVNTGEIYDKMWIK